MTDTLEKVLVLAPGRGSYGEHELGYLARYHAAEARTPQGWLKRFDAARTAAGQPSLSALDGSDRFDAATYSRGDVATPLIYAASWLDFLAINRERFDPVVISGNSMGWYTALACSGAVTGDDGFAIANAMGFNSQAHGPGGQIIVSLVDDQWCAIQGLSERITALVAKTNAQKDQLLAVSINLGGVLVLAGNEAGLQAFIAALPPKPKDKAVALNRQFKGRLAGHGPFHTPLMRESSLRAKMQFDVSLFSPPTRAIIDGTGFIWRRFASDAAQLWDYSLGHQILTPYDFAGAVRTALKEYAPSRIILLGPSSSLGSAIAQILINLNWRGLRSKNDFAEMQDKNPFLLAMGRSDQRQLVV